MKRVAAMVVLAVLLLAGCAGELMTWQEQYDLGMRYLNESNYEEAILAFTQAIEIDPKNVEGYLGRAEAYAAKHSALLSACDGIGMGLGFTCALTIIGFCRELIGSGSVFGYQIIPDDFHVGIFIMAPGAFLVLACLTAIQNKLKAPSATNLTKEEKAKKKLAGEPAGCTGECGSCMLHAEEIVDKKIELKKADCQKLETARNEEGGNR